VEELQAVASSILVPLRVTAPEDTPFRASVDSASVGPAVVARIRSTPHLVSREAHRITSADRDLLKVVLHRRGSAKVTQDSRERQVEPGALFVFDTARPYEFALTGTCDVVVVGMPRDLLGSSAGLISRRTAAPLPSGTGTRAVVAAFLSGLGDHLSDLPGSSGVHLADALASLLVAAFTDTTPERADVGSDLTDRIIAYTLANLADPGLSVGSVARHHGISPRHLHQLFSRRGHTFAAWVRLQRLQRIRRDLLDPASAQRTTAAIAAHWGILDPGHLGRALKREFGQTAAEIRHLRR
jgi:AraC-like DNA-binding protein